MFTGVNGAFMFLRMTQGTSFGANFAPLFAKQTNGTPQIYAVAQSILTHLASMRLSARCTTVTFLRIAQGITW